MVITDDKLSTVGPLSGSLKPVLRVVDFDRHGKRSNNVDETQICQQNALKQWHLNEIKA